MGNVCKLKRRGRDESLTEQSPQEEEADDERMHVGSLGFLSLLVFGPNCVSDDSVQGLPPGVGGESNTGVLPFAAEPVSDAAPESEPPPHEQSSNKPRTARVTR